MCLAEDREWAHQTPRLIRFSANSAPMAQALSRHKGCGGTKRTWENRRTGFEVTAPVDLVNPNRHSHGLEAGQATQPA